MRKKWAYLLLVFILCACQPTKKEIIKDRVQGIVPITYAQLEEKLTNNHDFVLYIGRSDCQDCIEFHPQLEAFLNQNPDLGVYYLEIKTFRDEAKKEDATQEQKVFYQNLTEELDFDWVPTLQHRQGKEIVSKKTYLDDSYYQITDKSKQTEAKQQCIQEIETWLSDALK